MSLLVSLDIIFPFLWLLQAAPLRGSEALGQMPKTRPPASKASRQFLPPGPLYLLKLIHLIKMFCYFQVIIIKMLLLINSSLKRNRLLYEAPVDLEALGQFAPLPPSLQPWLQAHHNSQHFSVHQKQTSICYTAYLSSICFLVKS